ncbi:MAG: ATP-binding cassette domain-containing protein [Planctomycetes bacterium]|nr:ATP-binding cassette domain-containing protein [Planctomycetota bacterium]
MKPLVVQQVARSFEQGGRRVEALAGVDLEVQQGDFVAIMGASGSGKSTLLHLVAGLTSPDRGSIRVADQDLAKMNDKELTLFRRKHIGLIFQSFNLIPTLSAVENVALPLRLGGASRDGVLHEAQAMLRKLGLAHRVDHRPEAMSGGEQQRVAIGRALITQPDLILADEPTGNLDSAASQVVCQLLRDLCEKDHVTILMVTHEPSVAAWAKQVIFIADGRIVDRFDTASVDGPAALAQRYQSMLHTGDRGAGVGDR